MNPWTLQLFIWSLVIFYIAFGALLIIKGKVITQTMYDVAQKLSHMEYGWLIILGFMSTSPSSLPGFTLRSVTCSP